MLEMQNTLSKKLNALKVRVDLHDENTAVFRQIPVDRRFFNKKATNVLLKRPAPSLPFVVCVDEDLEYLGQDSGMHRAFACAECRNGWRVLYLNHMGDDFQAAVEKMLAALGTDGQEPFLPSPRGQELAGPDKTLLAVLGVNLTEQARRGAWPTIAREEEVEAVASCVLGWGQARLAVVVGESGAGKTNLLQAVAGRLLACRGEWNVFAVDMASLLAGAMFEAEHESLLARLLDQAAALSQVVLALEHVELAVKIPRGPLLLSAFLDKGRPLIGTILNRHAGCLLQECLARRLHLTELAELPPEQTVGVLAALRPDIARHHRIEIDDSCLPACVRAAGPLAGTMPAKALKLLDAAAARSALAGASVMAADDVYAAARRLSKQWDLGEDRQPEEN